MPVFNQCVIISVIVPVFNAEKYLRRCVDSILAQTFTDFELLLIDDGSSDNSGAICDEYASRDPRVRVFHKPNGGVSSARNLGLDNARGEWISFVDSDDTVVPDYCRTLMRECEDFDILFFSMTEYTPEGIEAVYKAFPAESRTRANIENIIRGIKMNIIGHPFFIFTCSKLLKREIIEKHKVRFVEDISSAEDEIFTDEYCRFINSIKVISIPLYNYYRGSDGLTYAKYSPEKWLRLAELRFRSSTFYEDAQIVKFELQGSLECLKESMRLDAKNKLIGRQIELLSKIERADRSITGRKLKALTRWGKTSGKLIYRLLAPLF